MDLEARVYGLEAKVERLTAQLSALLETATLTGTSTFGGDARWPDDATGVVLKDRDDGTFYRLYVDTGALDIEAE